LRKILKKKLIKLIFLFSRQSLPSFFPLELCLAIKNTEDKKEVFNVKIFFLCTKKWFFNHFYSLTCHNSFQNHVDVQEASFVDCSSYSCTNMLIIYHFFMRLSKPNPTSLKSYLYFYYQKILVKLRFTIWRLENHVHS